MTGHDKVGDRFYNARFQDIVPAAPNNHGRDRCAMTDSEFSIFHSCRESDQNSTFDSSTEKFWTQGLGRWHPRSTPEKADQTEFEGHHDSIARLGGDHGRRQWDYLREIAHNFEKPRRSRSESVAVLR